MALKVIGGGFGRTGTMSLKLALEQIGFEPCYHMVEVFEIPDAPRLWLEAGEGNPDWDAIFAGYQSAVDFPTSAFTFELAHTYPEAKVILTERDSQGWFDSTQQTIFKPSGTQRLNADSVFSKMVHTVVWERVFDNRVNDRDHAIAVYERHNEAVKRRIPPNACWSTIRPKAGAPYAASLAWRCLKRRSRAPIRARISLRWSRTSRRALSTMPARPSLELAARRYWENAIRPRVPAC